MESPIPEKYEGVSTIMIFYILEFSNFQQYMKINVCQNIWCGILKVHLGLM